MAIFTAISTLIAIQIIFISLVEFDITHRKETNLVVAATATTIKALQQQQQQQQSLAPKLVDIAREFTHLEGANVTLVCSLSSGDIESLSFDWLKDDSLITSTTASGDSSSINNRLKIDVLPNKEHSTLKITDLNESDGARYACIARNLHGSDKVSTKLRVKG